MPLVNLIFLYVNREFSTAMMIYFMTHFWRLKIILTFDHCREICRIPPTSCNKEPADCVRMNTWCWSCGRLKIKRRAECRVGVWLIKRLIIILSSHCYGGLINSDWWFSLLQAREPFLSRGGCIAIDDTHTRIHVSLCQTIKLKVLNRNRR